MIPISNEEVKDKVLEILEYIDSISRENGINYSLGGGSLLGAVRHNGFIPWDNDADIMLLRDDYEKLINILKDTTRYKLIVNNFDGLSDQLPMLFAKLVCKDIKTESINADANSNGGVGVDIFPIDKLPSNEDDIDIFKKRAQKLMRQSYKSNIKFYWMSNSLKKKYIKLVVLFPIFLINRMNGSMAKKLKIVNDFFKSNDKNTQSSKVAWLGTFYDEQYDISLFSHYKDYQFESTQLMGIKNADDYLKNLYGDYMMLPPKGKRIAHDFVRFYKVVDKEK